MRLLDTDILIDIQRGHPPAVAWFAGLQELPEVPGFVAMELIQSASNLQQVRAAVNLTAPFSIVWPTADDCRQALDDFSRFHVTQGLGLLDALIAATALGRAASLCTFNVKHYRAITGLTLEQPYIR